jgi:hypothetical protein
LSPLGFKSKRDKRLRQKFIFVALPELTPVQGGLLSPLCFKSKRDKRLRRKFSFVALPELTPVWGDCGGAAGLSATGISIGALRIGATLQSLLSFAPFGCQGAAATRKNRKKP